MCVVSFIIYLYICHAWQPDDELNPNVLALLFILACSLYSYTIISFRLARTEAGIAHIYVPNVVLFIYYFFFVLSHRTLFSKKSFTFTHTHLHTHTHNGGYNNRTTSRLSAFTFRPRISFCIVRLYAKV